MAIDNKLDTPRAKATTGMDGQGFYDHHSEAQGEATLRQQVRLRNACLPAAFDLSGFVIVRHLHAHPGRMATPNA